jgi:hypothetical protein
MNEILKALIKSLPKWGQDQRLTILLGMEVLASYNPVEGILRIKKTRCNFCGECCMDFAPNSKAIPFGADDEGKCNKLIKDRDGTWKCEAKYDKPYRCLHDPSIADGYDCSISHIEEQI